MLERYAINSAGKINLVSAGFLPYFPALSHLEFEMFTNGIDDQFLKVEPKRYNQDVPGTDSSIRWEC